MSIIEAVFCLCLLVVELYFSMFVCERSSSIIFPIKKLLLRIWKVYFYMSLFVCEQLSITSFLCASVYNYASKWCFLSRVFK